MATINLNAIRSLLLPGLDTVFGDYDRIPTQWKEIFEQKTSKMAFERDIEFKKFGLARTRNEGESTQYDDASEGPSYVYRHFGVSIGFVITKYALEDNLYSSQFMPNAEDLKQSMAQTKEVYGAAVLNNATSSSYLGGDGVSLLSTAHPLEVGTFSNTPAVAAELNETSLGDAGIAIRRFKDRAGLRVMARARKLVVTPELQYVAERLLRTSNRVGTTDNDINAVRDVLGLSYTVNDFITNTKAWFVLTTVKNGLKMYQRTGIEKTMQTDFDNDNLKTKVHERYSMGWSNARAIYGSMP